MTSVDRDETNNGSASQHCIISQAIYDVDLEAVTLIHHVSKSARPVWIHSQPSCR
jgi:hypothetical protein